MLRGPKVIGQWPLELNCDVTKVIDGTNIQPCVLAFSSGLNIDLDGP
jgi:hypothetical protein